MKKPASVMIVEDEALIALQLADDFSDSGYSIIGPFSKKKEALAALQRTRPDAVFLDVNLGPDGMSFDIAAELRKRDVPFVFLTGYSALGPLKDEFKDVEHLAKPITQKHALSALAIMLEDRLGS